jgi:hypothetical protein
MCYFKTVSCAGYWWSNGNHILFDLGVSLTYNTQWACGEPFSWKSISTAQLVISPNGCASDIKKISE